MRVSLIDSANVPILLHQTKVFNVKICISSIYPPLNCTSELQMRNLLYSKAVKKTGNY